MGRSSRTKKEVISTQYQVRCTSIFQCKTE
jgi:hypothetical protein